MTGSEWRSEEDDRPSADLKFGEALAELAVEEAVGSRIRMRNERSEFTFFHRPFSESGCERSERSDSEKSE